MKNEIENLKAFDVKEKSCQTFFEKYASGTEVARRGGNFEEFNPYYFMRDEIILKKEFMNEFKAGDMKELAVRFVLLDRSRSTDRVLENTYLYSIEPYDDVCLKLVLQDFKVSAK